MSWFTKNVQSPTQNTLRIEPIIVEGIFTGGILAVHRHAFEAIDSAHCDVDNIQKQRVIVRLAAVYLYSKYTCCHEKQRYKQQEEQS